MRRIKGTQRNSSGTVIPFWLHLGKASLGAKPGMIGWILNQPDVNGNGSDRFVGHLFGRGKVVTLFVSGLDNLGEQERL